jgi:hypothetical protein
VSPILGIVASQNYQRITTTGFVSIATTTVGSGGTSSITFSGIPSVYKHLQIRGITSSLDADVNLRFNGDTGSNYSEHYIYGDGTTRAAGGGSNLTTVATFYAGNDAVNAVNMGPGIFDILDYANTNKYKTMRGLTGPADRGLIVFRSSSWRSTSAITSITLTSTLTIREYSQIALYGIEG